MEVFISEKNKSILKSLIEKSVRDKFSINIYNSISESVLESYITKKIRILQTNIKTQNDIINYNKQIIINFINDFSKLNNKKQTNNENQNSQNNMNKSIIKNMCFIVNAYFNK